MRQKEAKQEAKQGKSTSDTTPQTLDQPDTNGNTPLMTAFNFDDLATAKFLLSKGASATITNADKQNLIHSAILACSPNILEFIGLVFNSIKSKETLSSLLSSRDVHGNTPMEYCFQGKWEKECNSFINNITFISLRHQIIKLLLMHGDNPYSKTNKNPLSEAIYYEDLELTYILLNQDLVQHPINANYTLGKSEPPIIHAIFSESINFVIPLLKSGIDFKLAVSSDGLNLFHLLVRGGYAGRDAEILKVILEAIDNDQLKKSLINQPGKNQVTPLNKLVYYCYSYIERALSLLIQHGAKIDTKDKSGKTPLHNLLLTSRTFLQILPVLKLLLEYKAPVNTVDNDGRTPLMYVAGLRFQVSEYVYDHKYNQGYRPGQMEAVKLLLENNAKLDIKDKDGKTALVHAKESQSKDVLELLQQKLAIEKAAAPDPNSLQTIAIFQSNASASTSTSTSASTSTETLSEKLISMDELDEASENRKDSEIIRLKEEKESKSIPKTTPLIRDLGCDPRDREGKTKGDRFWQSGYCDINPKTRFKSHFWIEWNRSYMTPWLELAKKDVASGMKDNIYAGGTTAMHLAIASEEHEFLQASFSYASLDKPDVNGDTPLMLAFVRGDLTTTRFLLSKGASCKSCNHLGHNFLHLAIFAESSYTIEFMNLALNSSKSEQSLDQPDSVGNTPLMDAFDFDNLQAARFLIGKGASATLTNASKQNLLHIAIIAGRWHLSRNTLELMELVFCSAQSKEAIASLISARDVDGQTPMERCWTNCTYGEIFTSLRRKIIKLLLKHGDNPYAKTIKNPLAEAISSGDFELTSMLLNRDLVQHPININFTLGESDPPIICALKTSSPPPEKNFVELLIKNGVDLKPVLTSDIMYMLLNGGYTDYGVLWLRLVLEAIDDEQLKRDSIEKLDKERGVNLHYFCLNLEKFSLLLRHGAKVDIKDDSGNTPLHNKINALVKAFTYQEKDLTVIKLLLEYKAPINAVNNDGKTPLMCAAALRFPIPTYSLSRVRVSRPMTVSDHEDYKPFLSRQMNTVKLLLENGAQIDIKDKDGKTAIDYAKESESKDVLELLQKITIEKTAAPKPNPLQTVGIFPPSTSASTGASADTSTATLSEKFISMDELDDATAVNIS